MNTMTLFENECCTGHALAMRALAEPYRRKLTAEEIDSLSAFASLSAANESPAPHERGMMAHARAVLGISLSPTVPVWDR